MRYEVEISPQAAKHLRKINKPDRLRIVAAIELLAENPYPPTARRLVGRVEFRIRVGDCRIIYTVAKRQLVVEVIDVGHRRDIYHAER